MLTTTPAVHHSQDARREATAPQKFTPLELETRPTVDTAATAYYLRKAQQTLRIWACKENGPIRPIRVGAHLHWKTDDIRKLLGVSL
ncbi:MAG: hypothetical protein H7228_07350 [Polaromonas sp.]|nr:hypothetical protein [Polaromonas sp.]